ncbi:Uma2 family endonuclease [Leptolyngbya sp. FACHB-17]|uniref:Uma2 family endonuclease n=1 Tax=unclassified Leptolyngbya TaxID=2650499 RepID=UPI001681A347|nr:Uma2 family endonuclease [Leptolyngbya sp. FACHB-17]MBD2081270.1 Uma2 family endonuclease [Leptolyngbya sp. FACHB-17]
MVQSLPKQITFDEFIAWYPEHSEYRYELHNGEIIQMPKQIGKHSEVSGYIALKLGMEIERLQQPYFIPRECVVKVENSGYEPDVIVLNRSTIQADPRWAKESTITRSESAVLIVEVTSTNWSDDYALKLEDYEALGIEEYWICDCLGLGGKRYIGSPKQPTFSVYQLNEAGEYEVRQFRGEQAITSKVFPELQLSLNQVLDCIHS